MLHKIYVFKKSIQFKNNGQCKEYFHRFAIYSAWLPAGHCPYHPQCLIIAIFVYSFHNLTIGNAAIHIHHKFYHHTTLYIMRLGAIRILHVFTYILVQIKCCNRHMAAGILYLLVILPGTLPAYIKRECYKNNQ